jgi:hypothetical protein
VKPIRVLLFLLAGALAASALPTRAADPEAPPAAVDEEAGETDGAEDWEPWLDNVKASIERIRDAQARVRELEARKSRGAGRRYPRGEEKAQYLAALAEARTELATAESEHPDIVEQARRGGVPAGILADYEEIPANVPPDDDELEDDDFGADDEDADEDEDDF